ncbi:uncharacterized protein LOC143099553 [Alosa pseudoharengus]|uniref:uncharacterized protein LOC143099553 n=1 Tax=Alosa pseudoharengus TaxID=34774 RepID=UPI003F8B1F39
MLHRQGTVVIGIRLLMTTLFCEAVMSASVPAHKSASSVAPEPQLGQSDSPVMLVPLAENAVLSCKPPGSLAESCISVQTKDTREKEPSSLFVTGPEKEVEENEHVLLYMMNGQEKPEFQSPLYRNRTSRWDGGDVSVELRNVSVSDNNTIFQIVMCPHCGMCVIQCEITLRITVERGDGGKGNPTAPVTGDENTTATLIAVAVPVLVVLVGVSIVVGCVCTRRKGANQDATEAVAMATMENGGMGRPREESVGNQQQPDGPVVLTKDQPNGSTIKNQDQLNGSTIKNQDQPNGSAMMTQQSGSADIVAEQEPLLRAQQGGGRPRRPE